MNIQNKYYNYLNQNVSHTSVLILIIWKGIKNISNVFCFYYLDGER